MRLILQEKIANLGVVGDQVTVKPGYGRNYLLPQGKAVLATPENIATFEKRRSELEKQAAAILAAAKARADKLAGVVLSIEAQASDEGKLYGSIGPREIADAAVAAGHELEKSEVLMPEGPIRNVGEHDLNLHLHGEVDAVIKVVIAAAEE